ncbi:hypothetical protein ACVXG9_18370 [Escherichia coli]
MIQRASSLVFESMEAKKHATRNRANGELFYGRRGTLTVPYNKRCVNWKVAQAARYFPAGRQRLLIRFLLLSNRAIMC